MNLAEYQELAQRTSKTSKRDKIINGCMGLNGEAGECIDVLKKHMFQGHTLDIDHMIEECGDCLWYIAELASGLGVSLDEVAKRNINKLRKRYPDGFEVEHSVHRVEYADSKETIKGFMTVEELAEFLNCGRSKAYELVNSEDFPTIRLGRKIVVSRDGLDEWINRRYKRE